MKYLYSHDHKILIMKRKGSISISPTIRHYENMTVLKVS